MIGALDKSGVGKRGQWINQVLVRGGGGEDMNKIMSC